MGEIMLLVLDYKQMEDYFSTSMGIL